MTRATISRTCRGQTMRLAGAAAFPEDVHEEEVTADGNSRIITPVGRRWEDLFTAGPKASEDFSRE